MTDLANTPSIDPEKKEWIDQAPYAELLDKWRHDPLGSEWFQGDVGDYFKTKLDEKRQQMCAKQQVLASKSVGWDKKTP